MKEGRKDCILLFFWVMMTQFTTTISSRPNAVTPTISPRRKREVQKVNLGLPWGSGG